MSGKIKKGLLILFMGSSLFSSSMTFANIRIKEVEVEQKTFDLLNFSMLGKASEIEPLKSTKNLSKEEDKITLLNFNNIKNDFNNTSDLNNIKSIDLETFKKTEDLHKFYKLQTLNEYEDLNLKYRISFDLDENNELVEKISFKNGKSNIFISNEEDVSNENNDDVNKYTVLTIDNLLNKDGFFKNPTNLSDSDKIEKINKVQKLSSYISKKYNLSLQESENIVYSVYMEANKKNLEPLLILSIISVESTFRKKARSHVGAVGLTQVMEKVHKKRIVSNKVDIWSIGGNIKIGTDILHEYLGLAKGNMKRALQMYNGASRDKTYKYSNKVFKRLNDFKVAYNDK